MKKRTKANLYLAFVRFFIKEAGIFIGFSPDISPVKTFLLENYLFFRKLPSSRLHVHHGSPS